MAESYDGDDCLVWPYARDAQGYGVVARGGKSTRAHRVVCRRVQGDPPSEGHHAAHSCGRGHEGCINRKHLKWSTPQENSADKELHGTTARGHKIWSAKLTERDVCEIRKLLSLGRTHRAIAAEFGVDHRTIGRISSGDVWRHIKFDEEQAA